MKIKLLKPLTIQGKTYPAGCVIGVYQPEGEAWVADGTATTVPDGTMARKAAYGTTGCVPPPGFAEMMAAGLMAATQKSATATERPHGKEIKQKTNTLKK